MPNRVLQTEAALERVAFELVEDMALEGLTYAEIRFAPQLSCEKGLSQEQVTEAVMAGVRRGMLSYPRIKIGLILCCMRGAGKDNLEKNEKTVDLAARYLGDVVCAVDLAGAEGLYDTALFESLFCRAAKAGVPYTIHSGEADGPGSVRSALAFGAKRIGHGVASARDLKLMEELAESGVALEVCVTSNVQSKAVPSLAEHPIRQLFDAGVRVTVNTDNRTVSGTTLVKEIELVKTAFGFTDEEIGKMETYAQEARFLR